MKVPFYKNDLYCDSTAIPKLEKAFAKFIGYKYAIAVNSLTNGYGLCLDYYKPKEVSIPAMTYVSMANEVVRRNIKLTLLDTWEAGCAYPIKGTPIWDCAHAIINPGPEYTACYSFYPTKLIPSYEGGMVCTNDVDLAEFLKIARQMGRTGYGAYYDVVMYGPKCNMTPIQARQALKSLKIVQKTANRHRDIFVKYLRAGIKPCHESDHLFITTYEDRHRMANLLEFKGIQTSWHFEPIYDKTAYKEYYQEGKFSYCERIKNKIISLPMFPTMTDAQVKYVIKTWHKYS